MRVLSCEQGRAEMHFSEHWAFPEENLYGTFEGMFSVCNVQARIQVASDNKGGCYLRAIW
jgi:hypothetical protein